MNGSISRKQRRRFFLANVTAFALIFFLLGLITLQVLNWTGKFVAAIRTYRGSFQHTDRSLVCFW